MSGVRLFGFITQLVVLAALIVAGLYLWHLSRAAKRHADTLRAKAEARRPFLRLGEQLLEEGRAGNDVRHIVLREIANRIADAEHGSPQESP